MRRGMPESHASHPNVVPMIDVIMVLIIFYMLVARIGVTTGEDETIKIPYSILSNKIKSLDNTLLVNVKEVNHQPMVTALVDTGGGGKVEELVLQGGGSKRRLEDVLKRLRFGPDLKPNTKDDNPDYKLAIRGDAEMPYFILEQVLISAANAQVKSVNFQTTPDKK